MNPVPEHIRRIFIDTSAYLVVANWRDISHQGASATMQQLVAERRRLFTTNFILAELHALLLTRINRAVAAQVLAQVEQVCPDTHRRVE
jgi:predicted nucleic acid-binding protein